MDRRPLTVTAVALALLGLVLLQATEAAGQTPANGCATCHSGLPQAELSAPPKTLAGDVHDKAGIACTDCHGGDAAAADATGAHDAAKGYRGRPAGMQIIQVCARCHSDAEFMHKFSPRQRVDQATEYASSVHGSRLAAGDARVATCLSCHGAHGVRLVNDVRSPAYPTNVAATCATCHSSAEHMRGYTQPGGASLPTNQRADYERSVHYAALVKQNDLSAPTCNDCHGNHGAAPPGVGSLTNVCGTCHAAFAARFATSVHAQLFDKSCIECHGNHAVFPPSDEMLGTSKETVCASCHETNDDPGFVGAERMRASLDRLKQSIDSSTELIGRVRNAGMEVGNEELALSEARSKLVLARTEVHAFDPASLDSIVSDGTKILDGVDQAGSRALSELTFRRRGLFVSLAAILLFVIALGLKVRDLRRTRT